MAHILQLVRVLPFAEAGTVFSRIFLSDPMFHRLADCEGADFGFGTKTRTNARSHSDTPATSAQFCLPRKTDPYLYR